jgi:hypothetical protein
VRLQIGQYHLKSHMIAIDTGGCDIVLGVEWLRTLGPILMDFKDLTMQFQQEGQQYKFQGITTDSPEIINSHRMEKILKKGHSGIISQLHSIHDVENFSLPVESMIIQSLSSWAVFLPMFGFIVILFPRGMKLRKLFINY